MNAIEIADMLAGTSGDFIEASILIRRQHAEIQEWRNVFGFLGTPDELGNEWNALKDANSRQHEAIKQLREALADTAQSIAWSQFGECRGFTESMPLPTITAIENARKALADTEEI